MMKISQLEKLKYEKSSLFEGVFLKYKEEFLKYNAHTNLISKNDEKVLFEKHIFDSLSINLFQEIKRNKDRVGRNF